MTINEMATQIAQKRGELEKIFKDNPERKFDAQQVEEINRRNDELTKLVKDYEAAASIESIAATNEKALRDLRQPATPGLATPQPPRESSALKSFGEYLRSSKAYEDMRNRQAKKAMIHMPGVSFKTLLTLSDINNLATRLPNIVPSAQEERTVADLMLQGTTDNNAISYMEETTFTNAAAETAEGAAKPESTLDFTERTDNVRKIATWIPATDELISDVSGFQSYVEGRLGFMVERREETQLLTGDGTAPNISGITDRSGIQTQAKGTDPTPDAVFKAMTKVRSTGFAEPTAAVFHPNDWQDIRLLRTADGMYIWGSPADAGPDRIWGLEVRVTTAMTEGTGLVGAFRPYAQIFRREGLSIEISTEHSTFFTENKMAIRAETRLALAVYRPAAFCTITGI